LELEDLLLKDAPVQVLPFIHWRMGRAHDMCTPTSVPTVHSVVPMLAYLERYLKRLLHRQSSERSICG
jgi:hypothetical protein